MSLEMLEHALPALTELTAPRQDGIRAPRCSRVHGPGCGPGASRVVDWELITDELGTRMPEDYMELVCRYQGLVIDNRLGIRMPCPGWERYYIDATRECLLELEGCWMMGDSGGHVPYPRPRGLIPWGGSIDGDTFYWRTHPKGPEGWTVVVCGADNGWTEIERDLTGYLAGLVLGEVEPCGGRPPGCPGATPSVSVDDGWRRHLAGG